MRDDSRFRNVDVKLLAPPVQENISGVKEACSTLLIRASYLRFFSCSCFLYRDDIADDLYD